MGGGRKVSQRRTQDRMIYPKSPLPSTKEDAQLRRHRGFIMDGGLALVLGTLSRRYTLAGRRNDKSYPRPEHDLTRNIIKSSWRWNHDALWSGAQGNDRILWCGVTRSCQQSWMFVHGIPGSAVSHAPWSSPCVPVLLTFSDRLTHDINPTIPTFNLHANRRACWGQRHGVSGGRVGDSAEYTWPNTYDQISRVSTTGF